MQPIAISVIMATYNRCALLPKALDSVLGSAVPESVQWEVVLVDNNSKDQTRQVADDYLSRHPNRLRYVRETQQGLSAARNAGIRESRGEVIVFTDDDIEAEIDWLWKLAAPLMQGEWGGAGGKVVPVWTCTPPRWFPLEHPWGAIVSFDPGHGPGPLARPPLGANMAFRKEMFEKYGLFRTDLGRTGNNLLSNEDIEFGRRLMDGGERLRYEPGAVVHHPVPENRLRKDYILSWWYNKARSDMRDSGISDDTKWFVAGIPLHLFRRLAMGTLRWMVAVEPSKRFYRKACLWHSAGAFMECYENRLTAAKKRSAAQASSSQS